MTDDSHNAPHTLEEKLAQGTGGRGDTVARRTLASLKKASGFRPEAGGMVSICPADRRTYWKQESGATWALVKEEKEPPQHPEET